MLRWLIVSLASCASMASAQPPPTPEVRVDFEAGPGFGYSSDATNAMFSFAPAVRLAHRSGHGARLGGGYMFELHDASRDILGPSAAWAEFGFVELAYAYRIRLAADARVQAELDLFAGPSYGLVANHQAGGSFCFSACPPPPYPARSFTDRPGDHAGAVVGLSIDVRAYHFVFGLDVTYRVWAALDAGTGHGDTHVFVAALHVGGGVY